MAVDPENLNPTALKVVADRLTNPGTDGKVAEASVINFTSTGTADTSGTAQGAAALALNGFWSAASLRQVPPVANARAITRYAVLAQDVGGGQWIGVTGAPLGTYTYNVGTVIVQAGGNGSAAWVRDYEGPAHVSWFGAIADGKRIASGCAITASDNTLTAPPGTFTTGDRDKTICVPFAGSGGAYLTTTIASYNSDTSVELADAASSTVSNVGCVFGTDSTAAFRAAVATGRNVQLGYAPETAFYLVTGEILFVTNGQHFIGEGCGVARTSGANWPEQVYGGDTGIGTLITVVGSGQRYVHTRRVARETVGAAEDAPMNSLLNIQAENVVLDGFNLHLFCDYTNDEPDNLGPDWDNGIMLGCRIDWRPSNVRVFGYWRVASIYFDVTRGDVSQYTSPVNGITFPGGAVSGGADGCIMRNVKTWGGRKGLWIAGGLNGVSGTYYDALTGTPHSDEGARGNFGMSDFHAIDCYFASRDHHSGYRAADPLSPLDYASEDIDALPACIAIDARRGTASQKRVRRINFTNCRVATYEAAAIALDRCAEVVFDHCFRDGHATSVYETDGTPISDPLDQDTVSYGSVATRVFSGIADGTGWVTFVKDRLNPQFNEHMLSDQWDKVGGVTPGNRLRDLSVAGSVSLLGPKQISQELTIENDAVGTFTPLQDGGFLSITSFTEGGSPQGAETGKIYFDVGGSLAIQKGTFGTLSANLAVSTSDVTGTTGTAPAVTVAVQPGVIKIENRAGATRLFRIVELV